MNVAHTKKPTETLSTVSQSHRNAKTFSVKLSFCITWVSISSRNAWYWGESLTLTDM